MKKLDPPLSQDPFALRQVVQGHPEKKGNLYKHQVAVFGGNYFLGFGTPLTVGYVKT